MTPPVDVDLVQNATPEHVETKFNELATVGTLVDRPELARVYIYVCYYGPVTRPQLQAALKIPKTTVYGHIATLVDFGIVTVAGDRPADVTAEPVCLVEDGIAITPTMLHAVALQTVTATIADFVATHGVGKLAAAVRQAGLHYADHITQRMAAKPLDLHTGEAMMIMTHSGLLSPLAASTTPISMSSSRM